MFKTTGHPSASPRARWYHGHLDRIHAHGAWALLRDSGLSIGSAVAPVCVIGGSVVAGESAELELRSKTITVQRVRPAATTGSRGDTTALVGLMAGDGTAGFCGIAYDSPVLVYDVLRSDERNDVSSFSNYYATFDDLIAALDLARSAGHRVVAISGRTAMVSRSDVAGVPARTEQDFVNACAAFATDGGLIITQFAPPGSPAGAAFLAASSFDAAGVLSCGSVYPNDDPSFAASGHAQRGLSYVRAQDRIVAPGYPETSKPGGGGPIAGTELGYSCAPAAIVAAVAALAWHANPNLERDELLDVLLSTADKDRTEGWPFTTAFPRSDGPRGRVGVVDAELAVAKALSMRADRVSVAIPYLRLRGDGPYYPDDGQPRDDPDPAVSHDWSPAGEFHTMVRGTVGIEAGAFKNGALVARGVTLWLDRSSVYAGGSTSVWETLPRIESWRNDYRDVRLEIDGATFPLDGDVYGLTAYVKERGSTGVTVAGYKAPGSVVSVTCQSAVVGQMSVAASDVSWEVGVTGLGPGASEIAVSDGTDTMTVEVQGVATGPVTVRALADGAPAYLEIVPGVDLPAASVTTSAAPLGLRGSVPVATGAATSGVGAVALSARTSIPASASASGAGALALSAQVPVPAGNAAAQAAAVALLSESFTKILRVEAGGTVAYVTLVPGAELAAAQAKTGAGAVALSAQIPVPVGAATALAADLGLRATLTRIDLPGAVAFARAAPLGLDPPSELPPGPTTWPTVALHLRRFLAVELERLGPDLDLSRLGPHVTLERRED